MAISSTPPRWGGVLQFSRSGVYVTTKFAVVGLSEALHFELMDEPIGVSAFCPGGVRSNIREYEKTRPDRFTTGASQAAPPAPPPGFNFSEETMAVLNQMSWQPEDVGEMVLRAHPRGRPLHLHLARVPAGDRRALRGHAGGDRRRS